MILSSYMVFISIWIAIPENGRNILKLDTYSWWVFGHNGCKIVTLIEYKTYISSENYLQNER